jgi:molecular chaperone GrpE
MIRRKRKVTEQNLEQEQNEELNGEEQPIGETPPAGVAEGDPALRAEVERLQAEVADWKDRALRAAADMENVRRRARLDVEEAHRFASERLITDLLPVLDNFTRALEASDQTRNLEALRSGVEQIHRQLSDLLSRSGVEQIEAVGQPFDPNVHEAIMQVEPEEGQEPNQVVDELRAGYKLSGRVIRPTLVKVTSSA